MFNFLLTLKHCLYFKLLRLVAQFSLESERYCCPLILLTLVNLIIFDIGCNPQNDEPAEKTA